MDECLCDCFWFLQTQKQANGREANGERKKDLEQQNSSRETCSFEDFFRFLSDNLIQIWIPIHKQ